MVGTPWGDSDKLRDRRLQPGPGASREEVRENQRQRLFAATVAAVAQKGYEAVRVADLLELSGISRKTFYEHFENKRDCVLATVRALVDAGIALVQHHYDRGEGSWEERMRSGLEAFVSLLEAQPAAARLCLVDVYAAGAGSIDPVEHAFADFSAVVARGIESIPGYAGMPAELPRAIVGGLRKVLHTRVHRSQEGSLAGLAPQLWHWGTAYHPPPQPLRRGRRRARGGERRAPAEYEQPDRLIRATAEVVAERGYAGTTVRAIAERASTSFSTFYNHFEDKEEAALAALDRGGSLLLAAVLPAFRRGGENWPAAVRGALEALCAFGVEEPAFSRLGTVEVYAAGPRALEQRDQVMDGMAAMLAPGYELNPEASPIAAEAAGGAIYAISYDQVRTAGPESLPEIAPLAIYIALSPFIGAEAACEVANSDGRGNHP